MPKSDKRTQIFQALYGEDTPTQLVQPAAKVRRAKETTTHQAPPLQDRVRRALEAKSKTSSQENTAVAQTNSTVEAVSPEKIAASSSNLAPDAPLSNFNHQYVLQRLNQGILAAQEEANYEEAIRLQELCFKLQDRELSPVQVAREAWLRPAVK